MAWSFCFPCLAQIHLTPFETQTDDISQRPKHLDLRDSFIKCSEDREIVLNLTISHDNELQEQDMMCFLSETVRLFWSQSYSRYRRKIASLQVLTIRIQTWSTPSVLDLTDAPVSEMSAAGSSSGGSSSNILLLHICTLSALVLSD